MRTLMLSLLAAALPVAVAPRQGQPAAAPAGTPVRVTGLGWAPDGRGIAFAVVRPAASAGPSPGEVWLADAEGAAPARRLAAGLGDVRAPRFSPAGGLLAFLGRAPGDAAAQLYLLRTTNRVPGRLTAAPGGVEAYDWTPAGDAIVYAARDSAGRTHLWAVGAAGGESRRLTAGPFDSGAPAVSPDGLWVAHERVRIARDGERHAPDLWLVPVTGGEARRLTTDTGPDRDPRWSPDGRRIAYTAAPGGRGPRIRVVQLDGRPPADLTDPAAATPGAPAWIRDGRLLFAIADGAVGRVVTIPADPVLRGHGVRRIVEGEFVVTDVALSPDGGRLAYVRRDAGRAPEVYVVPLDAGPDAARRITDLGGAMARAASRTTARR